MMIYRDFIDYGYKVFGLRGVDSKGKCTCDDPKCDAPFKHPLMSGWQHTPLWSDEQLEKLESNGAFNTGYGVLVSGLLVVDVDARNGGVESYARLADMLAGCGFVVETGSGGGSKHLYFKSPPGVSLVTKHDDYPGIDFKSSGYVVGPGSMHISGNRYAVIYGGVEDIAEAPAELIEILTKKNHYRAVSSSRHIDIKDQDIAEMLSAIDPCCEYDIWYKCGMAVHHATGGSGFYLWDEWSSGGGSAYPGSDMLERKWHSFGKMGSGGVSIGTLTHWAKHYGWKPHNGYIEEPVEIESYGDMPCDISGVDLLRPPGFVGDVCEWINNQCRFKRENLAAAAALVAVGNIAGLRYIDDLTDATANLFAFCVAESSTGKEAVMQAFSELHVAAGVAHASHGSIKSEQEIIRNIVRNQAAYYIIDEFGIFLEKIVNAQARGGAAYLDGVIGELMKIYSKSTGFMLLTGDAKVALIEDLQKQLAKAEHDFDKKVDLEAQIKNVGNGLKNPFLSLIGFTTGITFDGLCTMKQAQSGFIGRALLITERDSNPKPKRMFRKEPLSLGMALALKNLYTHDTEKVGRVEFLGERVKIPTTEDAVRLMDRISDWLFYNYAENHKSISMEAIVRRGYEIMSKVSLILAIPGGVREYHHVVWAFALMKRDIDEKVRMVSINGENVTSALHGRILGIIDKAHAESTAVISNRCRPVGKEDVLQCLEALEAKGKIKKIQVKHPQSKTKMIDKWLAI